MMKAKTAIPILLFPFCMIHINAQKTGSDLPAPVEKYFKLVLPENPSTIKEVWLTHKGYFKSSQKSDWVEIDGKQHFLTERPEFEWTGKTKLLKATDCFKNGKGQLSVKLLGFIPIVNARGSEVDQAELLRWLGESVWFPTSLLPGNYLSWSPMDSLTARLDYTYRDYSLSYLIRFDEPGHIIQLETERYMEKGKLYRWIGKVSDYKKFHGVMVPAHIEALWRLEEGDFQYVDFYVSSIDYKY
jgi:Family of unknown function (DUF6544)